MPSPPRILDSTLRPLPPAPLIKRKLLAASCHLPACRGFPPLLHPVGKKFESECGKSNHVRGGGGRELRFHLNTLHREPFTWKQSGLCLRSFHLLFIPLANRLATHQSFFPRCWIFDSSEISWLFFDYKSGFVIELWEFRRESFRRLEYIYIYIDGGWMLFQGRLDRDEIWSNSFGVFTSLDSISYPLPCEILNVQIWWRKVRNFYINCKSVRQKEDWNLLSS